MKVYISADMEGTIGVVDRSQCFPGSPDFERTRLRWIEDINAIIEGASLGGATEFLVNEAHALMNYLLPERLDPRASYVSGYVKEGNQMEGLDASFGGAVIMGHAMAGTPRAVLNHSYVMREVVEMRLNGQRIGEFGLNAYWAATHGVPVILVVGDDALAQEAQGLIPEIETAVVKRGLSQFAAHNPPLYQAREVIRDAAERAVRRAKEMAPLRLPNAYELEIDFSLSEIAHLCSFIPGVERLGGSSVRFRSLDYQRVMQVRILCTNLALAIIQARF